MLPLHWRIQRRRYGHSVPVHPTFLITCSFREKIAKLTGWHTHFQSWRTPYLKPWIHHCTKQNSSYIVKFWINSTFTFVTMDSVFSVSRATEQLFSFNSPIFFNPMFIQTTFRTEIIYPLSCSWQMKSNFPSKDLNLLQKSPHPMFPGSPALFPAVKTTTKGSCGLCDLPLNE